MITAFLIGFVIAAVSFILGFQYGTKEADEHHEQYIRHLEFQLESYEDKDATRRRKGAIKAINRIRNEHE